MFEALHGSAPDIAGRDIAKPSGLLMAAVMMRLHLGRTHPASAIHNAWLRTLAEGIHTADVHREGASRERVGTQSFAQSVVERLGQRPQRLPAMDYPESAPLKVFAPSAGPAPAARSAKRLAGIDVFVNWDEAGRGRPVLGARLDRLGLAGWRLDVITNRGVKVYPGGHSETLRTDHWRCRFLATAGTPTPVDLTQLLLAIAGSGLDAVKTENLYEFDRVCGYSQAQGE